MKRILFNGFLLFSIYCHGQGTSNKYAVDSNLFRITLQSFRISRPFLYHLPMVTDQENIKEFTYLMEQKPSESNFKNYYKLACSCWQLNKLDEAETLLLNIIGCQEEFYATTYRHSSNVAGDTLNSLYGYGSFTSNYKNAAALYLAKLYLEQKNYTKALQHLEDAVKKYTVTYTCGTGNAFQQEEYTALYAYCYEGLKEYNKVLEVLLPHFFNTHEEMLIPTIKRLYTQREIEINLLNALTSMQCTFDTLPTLVIQSNDASGWDTITYYSGRATINLFGKSVVLYPAARKDVKRVTKEHFIASFKESRFYQQLVEATQPSKQATVPLRYDG